ncbi:hypothetical protein AMQ84_26005 [Paenibacillus riograndensis]|uniref:Uncharacterized protein n=1 Tax=Paenibacillus riograndensis TaxID=483937 RepID=A0A132TLC8_9BACL|nr:hypothetical protein [Paenibacillus riograndensis]KWX72142.1 hypothetical protein AMQ84_26005 [Paenibacillus riograndensis]
MNKYGKAAIRATQLILSGEVSFVDEAWNIAITENSTTKPKACPRSAFLGLCEAGLIKGVQQTHVNKPLRDDTNKNHAIEAVVLLSENDVFSSYTSLQLWRAIMKGNSKSHNFQMDVVLALWNNSMINTLVTSK